MAGKPKTMSLIKQLLQLHLQGRSRKFIARALGISKNTVKTYLEKLSLLDVDTNYLLSLEDPVLEAKFYPGNPSYKEEKYDDLKLNFDYYIAELKRTGVTRKLLWEECKERNESFYSYSQFCFHLNQYTKAQKPSMILTHLAGEKLYIDFAGKQLSYIDKDTGDIIKCQVFVACLPYSDYGFAIAVRHQNIEDFICALRCCLEFLGGTPAMLVPDNLKAAIVKANLYEPDINRVLEDFANHYNTVVVPARVAKPKDKALVENQVKVIYTRVYARLRNTQFFDLSSLNRAIQEKVLLHNQTRMQKKAYCREEKFLADEKSKLKELPVLAFQIKYYKDYKVAKNNFICLTQDNHYYSVPHTLIGQKVKVIYTRSMVYIFHNHAQVAIHIRNYKPGGYTYIKEHLCSHHQHFLDRSPLYYFQKSSLYSSAVQHFVKMLFKGGRPPEQNYRTCDGVFSLSKKTSPDVFERAIAIANECNSYSYKFLLKVISNLNAEVPDNNSELQIPKHENIRGREYYQQSLLN